MAKVNRYTLTSLPHPLHGELDDIKGRSMFIDMNEDQAGYSNLNNTEPQRHEYHEIIWLSHGTAVHFLDGERRELPTNTLVSIPKGSIHNLCPSPDCRISRIRFRQEFLKSDVTLIFEAYQQHRVPAEIEKVLFHRGDGALENSCPCPGYIGFKCAALFR